MKALTIKVLIITLTLLNFSIWSFAQGVAINADGSPPHSSSGLDIDFSDKGFLVPRLTTSERDAITSPIEGLQIFNTTDRCLQIRNGTSSQWENIYCFSDCASAPVSNTTEAATNITNTNFDANWTLSSGATNYYIDVDDNSDFSSPLSGFNNLNVGNVITYNISGLTCGTTYYYRVRANNDCGTSSNSNTTSITTNACFTCGASLSDSRDGKTYNTVSISGSSGPYCLGSSQCWMAQNLDFGTMISGVGNQSNNGTVEKFCYNDNSSNCTTYGGLYQWDEMMNYNSAVSGNGPGPNGICPSGWHIPTQNEVKCMEMNLGMSQAQADATGWRGSPVGSALKDSNPPANGTNTSGFTKLMSGARPIAGTWQFLGTNGMFWTSTKDGSNLPFLRSFQTAQANCSNTNSVNSGNAYSIRCVKD